MDPADRARIVGETLAGALNALAVVAYPDRFRDGPSLDQVRKLLRDALVLLHDHSSAALKSSPQLAELFSALAEVEKAFARASVSEDDGARATALAKQFLTARGLDESRLPPRPVDS